jgi:hypothetical protein
LVLDRVRALLVSHAHSNGVPARSNVQERWSREANVVLSQLVGDNVFPRTRDIETRSLQAPNWVPEIAAKLSAQFGRLSRRRISSSR